MSTAPIILVPGIKATELVDTYSLSHEALWSLEDLVVGDVWEDPLELELRDGQYDARPTRVVRERRLVNVAYAKMIEHLRREVTPHVYGFPYDWRKPLEQAAERLVAFTEHILGKLTTPRFRPKVSFVTHSMGGLVLRSALGKLGFENVYRAVFIAPPFRGSCAIPEVLIKGEKSGLFGSDEDFRKIARTFPAVYQLIPDFDGAAVDRHSGKSLDLFDYRTWQRNVAQPGKLDERFLKAAAAFRRGGAHGGAHSELPMLSDAALAEHADQVAVVMSCGHETTYSIAVDPKNTPNPNWFDFDTAARDRQGDTRVHFRSAAVAGVTFAAFKDAAAHGTVCRDSLVIKAATQWLSGQRILKMTPREPRHSVKRSAKRYFEPYAGAADWTAHVA